MLYLAAVVTLLCAGPLSEYPSIKQLSKFQLRKWFKLGLHFNIPKHQMEGIRKHQHPTTKTLLAARVKNMELKWKDIVEGLLRIGKYILTTNTPPT